MGEKGYFLADWRKLVEDEAKLRGYSDKTVKAYLFYIDRFVCSGKDPREFLVDLIDKGYSVETVRITGFAVKFYLKVIEHKTDGVEDVIKDIPNAKKEKRLPVILSKQEIERMIVSTNNLKHRMIIMVAYSAGLRAGEVIDLRWPDIDFRRNIIHIKKAKGKKDRVVMLSPKVKKGLKALGLEDEGYVFLTDRGNRYSLRSVELIVKKAKEKAGIKNRVTPHTLRHSFATHLLERGTDLGYIKELLGHANISTTLIYTKVSNRNLSRIKSPIDE